MFNVKNKKIIATISRKSLSANRLRNRIAVLAIVLTTILFTTVCTISLSFNDAFQQYNFRQAGGYAHGSFKYLSQEQLDVIKEDPLIKAYGIRRFVGSPHKVPFNKSHVEIGYSDANDAKWMFLNPIEGNLPAEGTMEVATDTNVLALLGVEPVVGETFEITFEVDGTETTQNFILSGFWEYDEATQVSHMLIPDSRATEIFNALDTKGNDGMTGSFILSVMFDSTMNIANDVARVLQHYGYQSEDPGEANYVSTGVNWSYTGAQLAGKLDITTIIAIAVVLLLVGFTGYLIIYNVFQISVSNDIQFYGLLKTIGTTPKQLRRIVVKQALLLSGIGIPIGLILGYGIGVLLAPVVFVQLNGVVANAVSTSYLIFVGATLFSLVTVYISCKKPSNIAANVSPIEAIRYTERSNSKRTERKNKKGVSLTKMAFANLGRNKSKTVVTVISLSLAIMLLNLTFTFTNGFDMDKYLRNVVNDFQISDASYFQVMQGWNGESVSEDFIKAINEQAKIINEGRVYGKTTPANIFVTEEYFRKSKSR